jgi:hypothetical protein
MAASIRFKKYLAVFVAMVARDREGKRQHLLGRCRVLQERMPGIINTVRNIQRMGGGSREQAGYGELTDRGMVTERIAGYMTLRNGEWGAEFIRSSAPQPGVKVVLL